MKNLILAFVRLFLAVRFGAQTITSNYDAPAGESKPSIHLLLRDEPPHTCTSTTKTLRILQRALK